jgi:hypothetical protein
VARRLGRGRAGQGRLAFKLDLEGCSPSRAASLIFVNNEQPTATVHGAKTINDFVSASASFAGHGHPDRRGVTT